MKKQNVPYNNAFRILFGISRDCSPSTMFATSGISSSEAIMRKDIFRFINRLEYSNNDIIKSLDVTDTYWKSRIKRHWMQTLLHSFQGYGLNLIYHIFCNMDLCALP